MVKREPRFGGPPPGAHNVDNGTLYEVAYEAAKNIKAPLREGGESGALVSIAFSVIALESFLNEATQFVGSLSDPMGTGVVTMFRRAMGDLEQSSSITLKYSVSHLVLTGKPADFGAAPYQDLTLLVSLRNELVHFKPTAPLSNDSDYHPLRERLRAKLPRNILAEEAQSGESWLFHVSTKAVAQWACNTAANVVLDFIDGIPQSGAWGGIMNDLREPYFSLRF